jgi:hypothetical protein
VGVSGPLWLIPITKKLGFDIGKVTDIYKKNLVYITKHGLSNSSIDDSLFTGSAGIALALTEAYHSRLLHRDNADQLLAKCFTLPNKDLSLASGVAGKGMALLAAQCFLNPEQATELLNAYVNTLIDRQLPSGGWGPKSTINSVNNILSLDQGIPGIIWFLLHVYIINKNLDVLLSIKTSLRWLTNTLQKNIRRSNDVYNKFVYKDRYDALQGITGLILVLTKSYEVLKDNELRQLAESQLKLLPDRPVFTNFTLGKGVAGIGQLYLEAYRVFKNELWWDRATWIVQLLITTFQNPTDQTGYWLQDNTSTITADLFEGNAGIIHFLMHYLFPDKICHPLIPLTNSNLGY